MDGFVTSNRVILRSLFRKTPLWLNLIMCLDLKLAWPAHLSGDSTHGSFQAGDKKGQYFTGDQLRAV